MPFDALTWPEQSVSLLEADLEVLTRMRESIRERGAWCQGNFEREDGARCLIGWLRYHATTVDSCSRCEAALARITRGDPLLNPANQIIDYNDMPWTTQRSVVRLIDRAMVIMRKE